MSRIAMLKVEPQEKKTNDVQLWCLFNTKLINQTGLKTFLVIRDNRAFFYKWKVLKTGKCFSLALKLEKL